MSKSRVILALAILPWLTAPLRGQATGRPSARQARLEAFRTAQEQVRACKREARKDRLESKRARLQETLERARDRVQVHLLHELHGHAKAPGPASGPSLRTGLLTLGGVCLLAAQAQPQGEVVARFPGDPEPQAPAAPDAPRPLPDILTDLMMEQLDSDELENAGPMVQRALQAQRTMTRNALGSALAFPLPAAATPGAQLLLGAFQSALADTAQDFLNDVLPPEFGPLPARRGAPAAAGGERDQGWNALQAAKKDLVAAIRDAKGVGSDIVVAATSLLGYGSFASVAYGLDIGAAITGIFTSTPVSGAGVATGTLSAVASQFFLMAYASDAIAGAVLVHKLKEPYIDALLKVGDAGEAWAKAYQNYVNLNGTGAGAAGSTGGEAEAGGSGSGAAGSTGGGAEAGGSGSGPARSTGGEEEAGGSGSGAAGSSGADAAARPAAEAIPPVPAALVAGGGPASQDQTSAAAPRARPFRLGW